MTKYKAVALIEKIKGMEESKELLSFSSEFCEKLESEIKRGLEYLNNHDFYLLSKRNFRGGEIEEGFIFKSTYDSNKEEIAISEVFCNFTDTVTRKEFLENFKVVSKSFVGLIGEYYEQGNEKYDRLAQQYIEIELDSRLK